MLRLPDPALPSEDNPGTGDLAILFLDCSGGYETGLLSPADAVSRAVRSISMMAAGLGSAGSSTMGTVADRGMWSEGLTLCPGTANASSSTACTISNPALVPEPEETCAPAAPAWPDDEEIERDIAMSSTADNLISARKFTGI